MENMYNDLDKYITFSSREDAERVLKCLIDLTTRYENVCVADLKDLVGFKSTYADYRCGWTSFETAEVQESGSEYILFLPKPEPFYKIPKNKNDILNREERIRLEALNQANLRHQGRGIRLDGDIIKTAELFEIYIRGES